MGKNSGAREMRSTSLPVCRGWAFFTFRNALVWTGMEPGTARTDSTEGDEAV